MRRVCFCSVLFEPPENVLDIYNRVIDKFTDGDCQTAQCHRVDGQSHEVKYDGGADQRERDGCQRDERRSEVHQKQKQNDDHQDATITQRLNDILDGPINEGLLRIERKNTKPFGQRELEILDCEHHVVSDFSSICTGLLVHGQNHSRTTAERTIFCSCECGAVTTFDLSPFDNIGHLSKCDWLAVPYSDHDLLQVFDRLDSTQGADKQFVGALFVQVSAGRVLVAVLNRLLHVVQINAKAKHGIGIDQHLELLTASTHREHLRDAGNCQESLSHYPVRQRS